MGTGVSLASQLLARRVDPERLGAGQPRVLRGSQRTMRGVPADSDKLLLVRLQALHGRGKQYPPCSVSFATGPLLSASEVHTNATASFAPCAGFVGSKVAVSNNNGVADSEITSQAKRALGAYPKPFALWSVESRMPTSGLYSTCVGRRLPATSCSSSCG